MKRSKKLSYVGITIARLRQVAAALGLRPSEILARADRLFLGEPL